MKAILSLISLTLVVCTACEATSTSRSPAAAAAAAAPAADSGWRDTFSVSKSSLQCSGVASFVNLTPGAVRVYKDDDVTLTITVLEQTRIVDGVTTRIVEEREERGGMPLEISRNFFAIDASTGDLYYFGEEVDIYKGGKLAGHEGAWISGANGARFGRALPGTPRVGDRYYQEVAPGVAMDRAEIVSLDDTVVTPAGTFNRCVKVKETTPLEKDVSYKWYAPGIGLVRDGEALLTSWSPRS